MASYRVLMHGGLDNRSRQVRRCGLRTPLVLAACNTSSRPTCNFHTKYRIPARAFIRAAEGDWKRRLQELEREVGEEAELEAERLQRGSGDVSGASFFFIRSEHTCITAVYWA